MNLIPLVVMILTPAAPGDDVSIIERANEVIAQKNRMKNRFTLKYRVESRTPTAPAKSEKASSSTLFLWRDEEKFRVDHFDSQYFPKRVEESSGRRHLSCENCVKEAYAVVTTILSGSPAINPMVEYRQKDHPLGSSYYCTDIDWRFLGLDNDEPCGYKRTGLAVKFTSFFQKKGLTTRRETRGDRPCLVGTWKGTRDNYQKSIWLSVQDGYNPIYFEETFEPDGVPEARTTAIDWQKTPGGHFYPKSLKYNSMVSIGLTKHATEKIYTITAADFDSPIDPVVFTLEGFGLNEGQTIGLPGLKVADMPTWRNGKIDFSYTEANRMADMAGKLGQDTNPVPTSGGLPVTAAYPAEWSITEVVSIVAGVLAFATAVAAFVLRRRRAGA